MYTYEDLLKILETSSINRTGTLLIHSSMKSIGEVDGGAETVLDVFMDYMKDGLLIFPTHTWAEWNLKEGVYNPATEKACVGILPNLFMKREGVFRSLHPTHSVAAFGKRAKDYVKKDESGFTPCPKSGCFGSLYEEDAQILFLGASLNCNTYIHSLEEQMSIPDRINTNERILKIENEDGSMNDIKYFGHYSSLGDVSKNYGKLLQPMLDRGYAREMTFGRAQCYLVDVKQMTDWVFEMLKEKPNLFSDNEKITVPGSSYDLMLT